MRVPGKLERGPGLGAFRCERGAVREHEFGDVFGEAGERLFGVRAFQPPIEGGRVRHPGDGERCAVDPDLRVFVHEHMHTETLENGQPLLDPGVILVIAGRKDDAVLGFEIRQRGHVFFKA